MRGGGYYKITWMMLMIIIVNHKLNYCQITCESVLFDCAEALHNIAVRSVSTEQLRKHLRFFTKDPHAPASPQSLQLAKDIRKMWLEYGIPFVEFKKYNVLLSEPVIPGSVVVRDKNGQKLFESAPYEKALLPDETNSDVQPPYCAYSPSGEVTGGLVFASHGRSRDFKSLAGMGVNITGKIVVMRFGLGSRNSKIMRAQKKGAVGVLLYADPQDLAPEGLRNVYPYSYWLPSTAVPRGTVKTTSYGGDPLTPGRPAIDGIYRIPIEELKKQLLKIPVHPISYGDAEELLKMMDGELPSEDWQGGLPFKYGVKTSSKETQEITLTVNNALVMKDIYNVIGTIRGYEEPDQLVIVGNHRDAWVFGGTDGSSGTAAMMEVSRILGQMVKDGWKPRRSIVFASWGAEEPGAIGSTEWVEENAKLLMSRAVAYINVDMAVDGNVTFKASATPLMHQVIMDAANKVPGPGDRATLYDDWVEKSPSKRSKRKPSVRKLKFSSDHFSFYTFVGVPSLDIRYTYKKEGPGMKKDALYHTLHDTFEMVTRFVDPDFTLQQTTARALMQCILDLADSPIIPFHVTNYTVAMESYRNKVVERFKLTLEENGVSFESLNTAIEGFKAAAIKFEQEVRNTKLSEYWNKIKSVQGKGVPEELENNQSLTHKRRQINRRLTQLEKAFINDLDPPVLKARKLRRHVLLTPASTMPFLGGLEQSIRQAKEGGTWEDVKQQLSLIVHGIQSATRVLNLNPI